MIHFISVCLRSQLQLPCFPFADTSFFVPYRGPCVVCLDLCISILVLFFEGEMFFEGISLRTRTENGILEHKRDWRFERGLSLRVFLF